MTPRSFEILSWIALLPLQVNVALAEEFTRLEFMWEAPIRGSGAWSQALLLTLDPAQPHRACLRSVNPSWLVADVRLEAVDAAGTRMVIDSFRHSRERTDELPPRPLVFVCRDVKIDTEDSPTGIWQFELFIDGRLAANANMRVLVRIDKNAQFDDLSVPYVRGRINPSRDALSAPEFKGLLEWRMQVDATGAVTDVEILREEGVGKLLRSEGVRAAYLRKL